MSEGMILWGFLKHWGDSKPEKKEITAAQKKAELKGTGLSTYQLQRDPAIQPTTDLHHGKRLERKSEVSGVFRPLELEKESTSKFRPR